MRALGLAHAHAHVCASALLFACGPARAGDGERLGAWPERDGRVMLTQFSVVSGLAVSDRLAFLVTPQGIAIYDRLFDAWRPPIATPGGLWTDQVLAAAADPAGEGVWVVRQGEVAFHDARHETVARAIVPGAAAELLFDRRLPGSAFVRAGGGWLRVSAAGVASPVGAAQLPGERDALRPSPPDEILRRYPGLRDFAHLLARDLAGRSWEVSALAEAPERSEVWLGTLGGGAYRVDPLGMRAEPMPFGLLDRGAGALVASAGGVWIAGAGNGRPARGGLVHASSDLQQWRWLTGPALDRFAGVPVHALRVAGSIAWMATDRGVVRVDVREEGSAHAAAAADGLPADRVLAIAASGGGEAWAGTARGLVRLVADAGEAGRAVAPARLEVGQPVLAGTGVAALEIAAGLLWIGSDAGLFALDPAREARPARFAGAGDAAPRLTRRVRALAAHEDVLAVVTDADVVLIDARGGRILPTPGGVAPAGTASAAAMDATTLWLAEPDALRVIDLASGLVSRLLVRQALPDEPLDIALAPGVAWIATREGVVRIRRRPDGSPW